MPTNTERRAAWAAKLHPHAIATTSSARHIQSVVEEAVGHIAALAAENAELLAALREHQEAAEFLARQRAQHEATRKIGSHADGTYMTVRVATAACNRVRDASLQGWATIAKIEAAA